MPALSGITAVRTTSNTVVKKVKYGATIAAGQPLYLDTADKEYKLARSIAEATAKGGGIAITPGVDGGDGLIATGGNIILVGVTAAVGKTYYLGSTAGTLVPETDLTATEFVTRIGTAATATQLNLSIDATGIQYA